MATETSEKRSGDERPFDHQKGKRLTLLPTQGEPFRFLPKHGQPSCVGEWLSQHIVKVLALRSVYVALVVTLILVIQVLHPFGLGRWG